MKTNANNRRANPGSIIEHVNLFLIQIDTLIDEWVNYFIEQIEETYQS